MEVDKAVAGEVTRVAAVVADTVVVEPTNEDLQAEARKETNPK